MKMAKPSKSDIDAAGDLMSLLNQIDRGEYPVTDRDATTPHYFDEDDPDHLRAFYDAVKATLDKGPGYPGRVIGGMCFVIMYDKNEIVDPDSDVIEFHPKIVKALEAAEGAQKAPEEVRNQILSEVVKVCEGRRVKVETWRPYSNEQNAHNGGVDDCIEGIEALRTSSTDQANADTGSVA